MKKSALMALAITAGLTVFSCGSQEAPANTTAAKPEPKPAAAAQPPLDATNIVSLALGSEDHTTLVAALKAAEYVHVASNTGPLTVFAPVNAAFDALPAGTVEGLLKPENIEALRNVLKYHVTTSAVQTSWLKDGQSLPMANGKKVTIGIKDGKYSIIDASNRSANIVASIPASNGMLYIIDSVLLPPAE